MSSYRRRFNRARRCGVLWRQRLGVTTAPDALDGIALAVSLEKKVAVYREAVACPFVVNRDASGRCPLVNWHRSWTVERAFEELAVLGMALYASPAWQPYHPRKPLTTEVPIYECLRNCIGRAFAEGFLFGEGGNPNG